MSTAIISPLEDCYLRADAMITQFIDVCPEHLWAKKFGGWPLWQQVYHAFSSVDFFVLGPGEAPTQALYAADVASLGVEGAPAPSKEQLREIGDLMHARALKFIESLDDSRLNEENAGLTARLGSPMTNIWTLTMLGSHMLYHLGSCDAALREHGLKGVF